MDQKNGTQPDQRTIDEILNLFNLGKLDDAKARIENCVNSEQINFIKLKKMDNKLLSDKK